MARLKTTISIDATLLRAARMLAAASDQHDYEVVEDALRQYLAGPQGVALSEQVATILHEVSSKTRLSREEVAEMARGVSVPAV